VAPKAAVARSGGEPLGLDEHAGVGIDQAGFGSAEAVVYEEAAGSDLPQRLAPGQVRSSLASVSDRPSSSLAWSTSEAGWP